MCLTMNNSGEYGFATHLFLWTIFSCCLPFATRNLFLFLCIDHNFQIWRHTCSQSTRKLCRRIAERRTPPLSYFERRWIIIEKLLYRHRNSVRLHMKATFAASKLSNIDGVKAPPPHHDGDGAPLTSVQLGLFGIPIVRSLTLLDNYSRVMVWLVCI